MLMGVICCLTACTTAPPSHAMNACAIFEQYPNWYWAAKNTEKKWGIPVSEQLAMIFQESSFKSDAKPPRKKLLWVIPWKHPTSATGYSQAIDQTWKEYKQSTGHYYARRNNFQDSTDFIGWYADNANRRLGISKRNTYAIYLAYHEGLGGYARGSYKNQPWLKSVAHKVEVNSWRYAQQIKTCQSDIKHPWWNL